MTINNIVKKEPPKGVKKYLGKTLYRLHITKYFGYFSGRYFVEVRCKCGVEKVVNIANIIWGTTRSCGCQNKENNQKRIYENKTKKQQPESCGN